MARPRKRHIQQSLLDSRGKPTVRNGKAHAGHGGKRPGAGRPPKGKRAGSPHKTRPVLRREQAVHVVLRVADDLGTLRKRHMYKALREASISVAKRELHADRDGAFRIVHISIQRLHVHLLVEADNRRALSRGMQSFQISAAKHLNRAVSVKTVGIGAATPGERKRVRELPRVAIANRRRGTVFPDRFHQEIITGPSQARRTLAYVLNNWRKHREDQGPLPSTWKVDPYSTGLQFDGWRERSDNYVLMKRPDTYEPMVVYLPKSWLLREGWRKHGLIGFHEVPSTSRVVRDPQRAA